MGIFGKTSVSSLLNASKKMAETADTPATDASAAKTPAAGLPVNAAAAPSAAPQTPAAPADLEVEGSLLDTVAGGSVADTEVHENDLPAGRFVSQPQSSSEPMDRPRQTSDAPTASTSSRAERSSTAPNQQKGRFTSPACRSASAARRDQEAVPAAKRFRSTGDPYLHSMQRSYTGCTQIQSHMINRNCAAFGIQTRRNIMKAEYISKGQQDAKPAMGSPGPGHYEGISSLGKQGLSENVQCARTRFGLDLRFKVRAGEECDNPTGPGQYPVIKANMEKLSGKKAAFVMGLPHSTRARPVYIKGASNGDLKGRCCVAASYDSGTTVGPAAERMYQTPRVLFAKSQRPPPYSPTCAPGPGAYARKEPYKNGIRFTKAARKICEREQVDEQENLVPNGPGQYKPATALGNQLLSFRRNPAALSFPMQRRFPRDESERSPGPGMYRV